MTDKKYHYASIPPSPDKRKVRIAWKPTEEEKFVGLRHRKWPEFTFEDSERRQSTCTRWPTISIFPKDHTGEVFLIQELGH